MIISIIIYYYYYYDYDVQYFLSKIPYYFPYEIEIFPVFLSFPCRSSQSKTSRRRHAIGVQHPLLGTLELPRLLIVPGYDSYDML